MTSRFSSALGASPVADPTSPDPAALPAPPVAPVRPILREHHGDVVQDPYEWLRDGEDPDVVDYLEAENAYAQARTNHLEPLRRSIFQEIKSRVKESDLSVPVASGPWWYYSRTVEGQQYAVSARSPRVSGEARPETDGGPVAGEQVIVDSNVEAGENEFFALGALTVSRDHTRVAFAVDTAGDERFDVVVRDIETGEVLDDSVRGIGYGCEFDASGEYLFYLRVDDAWRPHELWRHRVGRDPAEDVLLHRETDERFWMGLDTSRDERWLIVGLGTKTTTEVRLLPAEDPLGALRVVAPRREGVEYDVEPCHDRLVIVHTADNPEGDLAWAPLEATSHEQWVPWLNSTPGERFLGTDAFADAVVLSLRAEGQTALRVIPRDDTAVGGFGTPWAVQVDAPVRTLGLGSNLEYAATALQIVVESFVTPHTVLELDLATRERTLLKQQSVLGDFDPAHYAESRLWASAPDGTSVPISVVHRADLVPDGSHPAVVTAYGAYEVSSDPYFSVARLSLLDRGVVYAVAHVRGGGEMGRHWYDHGKLLDKPHSFTDTLACADALIAAGWGDPARMALEGGSAGGLLVGAVVNLDPARWRVVHAAVPFVDALTTMLRPDLPLTVGEWEEWGNPLADPEVYACMRGYTPYENLSAQGYPAILATTSLNDTRVFFTEPAKWVARLRATVTNDPATRPILLRTEMVAGHGGRSGRYAAWEQIAWEWAFVLDQLGVGPQTKEQS